MDDSTPLYSTGLRNLSAFVALLYTPFIVIIPLMILLSVVFGEATWFSEYGETAQLSVVVLSYILMALYHVFDVRDYILYQAFFDDRVEIRYPWNKSRPTLIIPYSDITRCHWALSDRNSGRRTPAEDRFFFHWNGHEIPVKRKPSWLSRMSGWFVEGDSFRIENYCYIPWGYGSKDFVKVLDETGLESKVERSTQIPDARLR